MSDGIGTCVSRDETETVMSAGQNLPSEGRALVPVAPQPSAAAPHATTGHASAFLAHLIATANRLPQARERRCAEPAEVIAAYRDAIARTHPAGDQ
jgi:hypothetical protein